MSRVLTIRALLPFSFIALLLISGIAQAQHGKGSHHSKNHHPEGSYTSQVQQVDTGNGFIRTTTTTNAEGKTAIHKITVVDNKENGTHTRSVTGTNFKGESYSDESTYRKTADGYNRETQRIDVDGKKVTRSESSIVDKTAGTVTKTISTTPDGGETTTKTVVKNIQKHAK